MSAFNHVMTLIFDLICRPFLGFAPMWALVVISLVVGVILLWIFGKVSNQESIRVIRDRIRGNLIGVRLFQNDIGVVLGLQGRIVWDTLVYMRYSLVPMLILMVPVLVVMAQLNLRFASRPLMPGERALVQIRLPEGGALTGGARLEAPEGLEIETPAVHMKDKAEVAWRIRAVQPGHYVLKIETPKGAIEKGVVVGEGWGAIPAMRPGPSLVQQFLYPGEAPIGAEAAIASAHVTYPPLPLTVFGFSMNWIVAFFVFSLISGFAFKGVLGVEF